MAGAKVMIDMRVAKGFSPSLSNEELRRLDDCEKARKAEWNYDPSREHLNFEIGKGGVVLEVDKTRSINQRIKENLESRGIENPNQKLIDEGLPPRYRTVVNFILGGNTEVMRSLSFGDQNVEWKHGADNSAVERRPQIEAWAKDAYQFMCKKYGEQNIAAFIVHLDEANPHVHCTVLPINEKEKFSFKSVFLKDDNTREGLSRYMKNLHTEFAEEVGSKYGMERGDSVKDTGAKHRTTEEYRKWLWNEAQKKEEEVEESVKTIKVNEKTILGQKTILDSQGRAIKHAAARLKAIQTMIRNLESHKADLEAEISKLQQDLKNGKITKDEADRKLGVINAKIRETDEKIADKLGKLEIAKQQLEAIENKKSDAEVKYNELKEKLGKERPVLNKQVLHEMQSLGYHLAAIDTQDRLASYWQMKNELPQEQQNFLDRKVGEIFDGSVIGQIAENTSSICSVATALYLGYIDSATTISESHGGGGGPGTGWGKKDDEDDLAFRRRCFEMGMQMMRPARRQQRKRS